VMMAAALAMGSSKQVVGVIALYALIRCAEMTSDILYAVFQAQERMEFIGRSLSIVGPLSLLGLGFGYWFSGSLLVAVACQLVARLSVLFLYDLPTARRRARAVPGFDLRPKLEIHALLRLVHIALPLAFATCLVMIAQYFPRLAVESALGLASLGIFAALFALAMAPSKLVSSMGVAVSVTLAGHFSAKRFDRFFGLLGTIAGAVALAGIFGVTFCVFYGEEVLRIAYTANFATHAELLVILVIATSIRMVGHVLKFGLIAARHFWWLTFQSGVAAMVAVIGCLVMVPIFGLAGAAYAFLLVCITEFLINFAALTKALLRAGRTHGKH
ncbi:MAG: hypothetical protein AAFY31_13415, partial [Pseudomonadota bacterium]